MSVPILQAVSLLTDLLTVASEFAAQATVVSNLLAKAQAEGRATLSADEWDALTGSDASARLRLIKAIEGAVSVTAKS